jgi:DNA-directed RNA polymerase subunit RPC12/RpoP
VREETLVQKAIPLILSGLTNKEVHEQIGISENYAGQIRSVLEFQNKLIQPKPPIVCPKCGKFIQADSKFCQYCGARILTREEELAERLEKCLNSASLLPSSAKDSFVKTVNEALAYFRERGKENAK